MISIRKWGEGEALESVTGGRSGTRYNVPTGAGKRKEHGWCGKWFPRYLAHIFVDDPLL
jgi:hypothetical protein